LYRITPCALRRKVHPRYKAVFGLRRSADLSRLPVEQVERIKVS